MEMYLVREIKKLGHGSPHAANAVLTSRPNSIRQLFAIIFMTCYPTQSWTLWEKYKKYMTETYSIVLNKPMSKSTFHTRDV